MADADGATKFADIENVEEGLESVSEKPVRHHFFKIIIDRQRIANNLLVCVLNMFEA